VSGTETQLLGNEGATPTFEEMLAAVMDSIPYALCREQVVHAVDRFQRELDGNGVAAAGRDRALFVYMFARAEMRLSALMLILKENMTRLIAAEAELARLARGKDAQNG